MHLPDADDGEELAAGKDLLKKEEPDSERRAPSSSVRKLLGPIASRATLSATGVLPAAILLVVVLGKRACPSQLQFGGMFEFISRKVSR